MPDRTTPSRARRVAIVRLTSLGDVIHTLPLAAALKQDEASTRVIWLAEARERIVLDDNPVVDEVVEVPLRRWRSMAARPLGLWQVTREFAGFRRALRALELDAVLDVQGWPHKTSPLAWLSGSPVRIGFSKAFARHPFATWFTTVQVSPPPDAHHIVDQNLALVGPLGLSVRGPAAFPLPRFAEADAWAADWWQRRRLTDRRVVALLPSSRGAAKHWPVASYRELIRRLVSTTDVAVLVLGGPGEEATLTGVADGQPRTRVIVEVPGPIPQLVGLLRRVDLAVGNDTGPIHIAAASHVPSLGLFGPTRGDRNGPYGPSSAYVQSPTARMADLGVDQVWDALGPMTASARSTASL